MNSLLKAELTVLREVADVSRLVVKSKGAPARLSLLRDKLDKLDAVESGDAGESKTGIDMVRDAP